MSKKEWKRLVGISGRLLLAFVFVFSQTAWAGQSQQTKDEQDTTEKAAAQQTREKQPAATTAKASSSQAQAEESESAVSEEKSNDPSHEGIKVHGHWTIEVRNPDGKIATHREFENSLYNPGLLSLVLARTYSIGLWEVDLFGGPAGPVCTANSQNPVCQIVESAASTGTNTGFQPPYYSNTLKVSASNGALVLSGTVVASSSGSVGTVYTTLWTCPSQPTPPVLESCSVDTMTSAGPITSATLSTPIPVSANQTISVTVNIHFS